MFLGVQIEKEVDQGPFQPGGEPLQQGKAGSGEAGRGLKIKDAQFFAHLPVGQGLEVELGKFTPFFDLHIIRVILPLGNRVVAEVGNGEHDVVEFLQHRGQLTVQLLDPVGDLPHFQDKRFGLVVFPGLFQRCDLFGYGIATVFQLFHLGQQGEAFSIDLGKPVDQGAVHAPVETFFSDKINIFTDKTKFKHDISLEEGIVWR